MALELNQSKHRIYEYVESRMSFIAPNLSIIVGASTAAKLMGEKSAFRSCRGKRALQRLHLVPLCGLQVLPGAWLTCQRCPPVTWCCWELKEEPCLASAAPPCCPTRASSTTVTSCRRFPRSAQHRRSFCSSAEDCVPEAALSLLVFRTSGERRHVWWRQSVRWPAGSTVSTRVQMARWLSGWAVVLFLISLSQKKTKTKADWCTI